MVDSFVNCSYYKTLVQFAKICRLFLINHQVSKWVTKMKINFQRSRMTWSLPNTRWQLKLSIVSSQIISYATTILSFSFACIISSSNHFEIIMVLNRRTQGNCQWMQSRTIGSRVMCQSRRTFSRRNWQGF